MSKELTIANLAHPQEVAFVAALFELGGPQHGAAAAMRAGYADNQAEAERVAAHLLAARRISAAIAGETRARFEAASAAAFKTLVDVCVNGRSEAARISAAQEILNRSLGPIPSRAVSITAGTSIEDLLARLDRREADGFTAME
jgi:hypothetical protein